MSFQKPSSRRSSCSGTRSGSGRTGSSRRSCTAAGGGPKCSTGSRAGQAAWCCQEGQKGKPKAASRCRCGSCLQQCWMTSSFLAQHVASWLPYRLLAHYVTSAAQHESKRCSGCLQYCGISCPPMITVLCMAVQLRSPHASCLTVSMAFAACAVIACLPCARDCQALTDSIQAETGQC